MNKEEFEAEDPSSVADDRSKASERRCLDSSNDICEVLVEHTVTTNDTEKEVDPNLAGKTCATNDIEMGAVPDLEGGTHATNNLEKKVGGDVEGESHATNVSAAEVGDGVVPKVGMKFGTVKEAYDYYNKYARAIGFSVRKQRTNKLRKDPSKIQVQTLCCSCEGFYDEIRASNNRRENKRFGCKAMFEVQLINFSYYVVTKFTAEHNHELVTPENIHLLRSQRKIEPFKVECVNKVPSSRIKQSEIFSYLCKEAGATQNLKSIQSDCSNLEGKKRIEFLKKVDAHSLLDYFKQKKQENRHYFYSFWTNEDFEVRGIFFCDAKSRRDYGMFGDTMYFNTTYRTSDYNMVCVPILGINSHGQITLFGCGMLNDETTDAVVWLFTTFMEAMGGKKPKTIFTNPSMATANAIDIVFPETHHRLYLWHIYQTAVERLAEVFAKCKSLHERFEECIYNSETVVEFEENWELMLENFGLRDNEWLHGLYELRQKWAEVYDRLHFCAGMTTKSMSESINNFLNALFGDTLILREFVNQCANAMIKQREKEMEAENDTRQRTHILYSNWSVEHEAAKKYTSKMFYSFQDEYRRTLDQRLQVERDDGTIFTCKVTEVDDQRRNHTLTYNQSKQSVLCSCRKFEFHGILCSHALKLFRDLEFTTLPSRYYLKRWTRSAMDEIIFDSYGEAILSDLDPSSATRHSELAYISQRIVMKGAKSSTMYSLAKSVMLELEAKVEAFLISEEEQRSAFQKNTSGTQEDLVSNSNTELPVQNKKTKRSRGQPKSKPKKMTPIKSRGKKGENMPMPQIILGAADMHQPTEEPFGFIHQPLHSQDQNQVLPWQGMCLPYNFMGCPEQSSGPFFASDYLFMPQQVTEAQVPNGGLSFPSS